LAELRHDGSDEKRQFEYNENPASAGFLLSGDTTGVFARCIASVPLSHRRRATITITKPRYSPGLYHLCNLVRALEWIRAVLYVELIRESSKPDCWFSLAGKALLISMRNITG